MNTLQLGLIHGNLRCFGANCNMSRITRFLCYFFLLKYSSVLYFTLFPSLFQLEETAWYPYNQKKQTSLEVPCYIFINQLLPINPNLRQSSPCLFLLWMFMNKLDNIWWWLILFWWGGKLVFFSLWPGKVSLFCRTISPFLNAIFYNSCQKFKAEIHILIG